MIKQSRRKFSPRFKSGVVLVASTELPGLSKFAKKSEVNPEAFTSRMEEFPSSSATAINDDPESTN
jgi:hypothetical protein